MRARLGLCCLLAACGARTPLGTGAAVVDAAAVPDAPAIAAECTWALAGPSVRISAEPVDVPGDFELRDAVPTTGGALVAWSTPGDLSGRQTVVARRVGFDLVANGDEHVVLSVEAAIWSAEVSVGFGHAAAMAPDGARCVLRPITVDGASNGAMVDVGTSGCRNLEATSLGFDLVSFEESPNRLDSKTLDPSGNQLSAATPIISGGPSGKLYLSTGRAMLHDGSFVVAMAIEGGSPGTRVLARHFGAHGALLGPVQTVATIATPNPFGTGMLVASVGSGAMASWLETDTAGARVLVSPLHADASPLGAPVVAVSNPFATIPTDLVPDVTGGVLLAWAEADSTGVGIRLRSLSADGAAHGAPIVVPVPFPGASFESQTRVVATGKQGIVVFGARGATTPYRVYAAPLTCAP